MVVLSKNRNNTGPVPPHSHGYAYVMKVNFTLYSTFIICIEKPQQPLEVLMISLLGYSYIVY